MRLATVVGTRPQLIKLAALQQALRARHDEVFIDTGQHWDEALAGAFFSELHLPQPHHALGVGGGRALDQIGRMLIALDPLLAEIRPDVVLVLGDTNSTLAGALAAAKHGIPVAHVEAGLRSFDRSMPEEINRVVVDHLSQWLFAPTPTAVANLAAEGIRSDVLEVGDLMQDLAARTLPEISVPSVLKSLPRAAGRLEPGRYLFATIHRAENREPAAIAGWAALLRAVARPERPVILAIHPGTQIAMRAAGTELGPYVRVIAPMGYRSSLAAQLHAAAVLTDSGGVQREAAWLRVPCLVLRNTTEWVEAMAGSNGRMVLVGRDPERGVEELDRVAPLESGPEDAAARAVAAHLDPAGAAERIATTLSAWGRSMA